MMFPRATRPRAGALCSIVALSLVFILESAVAQEVLPPTLQAVRLEQAPQIDGLVPGDQAWSGVIPDSEIRLKIRVSGMGNARFRMEIDLPGTADDQSVIFNLTNGYYETKIYL